MCEGCDINPFPVCKSGSLGSKGHEVALKGCVHRGFSLMVIFSYLAYEISYEKFVAA